MLQPTVEEIQEAVSNGLGWCTTCKEFTCERVEPDAEKYLCEDCGKHTVYGVEQALLTGRLS